MTRDQFWWWPQPAPNVGYKSNLLLEAGAVLHLAGATPSIHCIRAGHVSPYPRLDTRCCCCGHPSALFRTATDGRGDGGGGRPTKRGSWWAHCGYLLVVPHPVRRLRSQDPGTLVTFWLFDHWWHLIIVAAFYYWHNTGLVNAVYRLNNGCSSSVLFWELYGIIIGIRRQNRDSSKL